MSFKIDTLSNALAQTMQSAIESVRARRLGTVESVTASSSQSISASEKLKSSSENIFRSRSSLLNVTKLVTEQPLSTNLTGFYHFSWIILSFFVASTFYANWIEIGSVLSGVISQNFFSDCFGSVFAEGLLLFVASSSGLSVFFGSASLRFLRLVFPAFTLILGTCFGFYRNWSGLQRSVFLLHSLSVIMKIFAFQYTYRHTTLPVSSFSSTMRNYIYFLFAPTMVYSESYPKTARIQKRIVLERLLGVGLCGISMYIVVEDYIYPQILFLSKHQISQSSGEFWIKLVDAFLKLVVPCSAYFLLSFLFVFEYWCNLFAELTCFADRQFYTDWWNGVSFYDFSIRWNIPVHKFLQIYVYQHILTDFKTSKPFARFLTFLISSIFHELVMLIFMGRSKYTCCFLFVFQMMQIPLISLVVGSGWAHRNKRLANWVFLIMLILGLPTVVVTYTLFAD